MFQHIRRHLLSETITTPSTISLALTSHLPIHPPTLASRDDHNFRRHLICTGSFSIPLPPTLARKRSRLEDNISSASEFRSTRLLPTSVPRDGHDLGIPYNWRWPVIQQLLSLRRLAGTILTALVYLPTSFAPTLAFLNNHDWTIVRQRSR
jgi:hypothetical protein